MNIITKYRNERSPIKRKAIAEEAYIFFFNDFLTREYFAEYHGVERSVSDKILDEGKHWNNLPKIEAVEA